MSEGRRERGERLFREIVGMSAAERGDAFTDMTVEHLFGEVWARDDLSVRDRRLVTLAVLIALGQTGPLALHVRHALGSGDLTPVELNGLLIHLAHYAGWPLAAGAMPTVAQAIAEFEKSGDQTEGG